MDFRPARLLIYDATDNIEVALLTPELGLSLQGAFDAGRSLKCLVALQGTVFRVGGDQMVENDPPCGKTKETAKLQYWVSCQSEIDPLNPLPLSVRHADRPPSHSPLSATTTFLAPFSFLAPPLRDLCHLCNRTVIRERPRPVVVGLFSSSASLRLISFLARFAEAFFLKMLS